MSEHKPFFDIKKQYKMYKTEIDAAVFETMAAGDFIMGKAVNYLEKDLEAYTSAKHCISCANGTDALQIALMAIGVEPGDEIITTPFTFVATAETICLLGAKPVFVDIQPNSFLINEKLIENKITKKTKAIIPVSLFGQISEMDTINGIAEKYSTKFGHKIYVIEDAAQSFGAEYKGMKSGNVSDIATTSFFPSKPLGCFGDGGAIFTSDTDLAENMRSIRVHGKDRPYHHVRLGVNSRLDTIQAAILRIKLKYLDNESEIRRQLAAKYNDEYNFSGVVLPTILDERKHVFAQYTLRVENREEFREKLSTQGIPTAVYYPVPLHRQPAFDKFYLDCPKADMVARQVVSLPIAICFDKALINQVTENAKTV